MSGFNMPPGVSPGDLPGNRPQDQDFEKLVSTLLDYAEDYGVEFIQDALDAAQEELHEREVAKQADIIDNRKEGYIS